MVSSQFKPLKFYCNPFIIVVINPSCLHHRSLLVSCINTFEQEQMSSFEQQRKDVPLQYPFQHLFKAGISFFWQSGKVCLRRVTFPFKLTVSCHSHKKEFPSLTKSVCSSHLPWTVCHCFFIRVAFPWQYSSFHGKSTSLILKSCPCNTQVLLRHAIFYKDFSSFL